MSKKTKITPHNFMHGISHYQMTVFPEAGMHFIQILRFMCLDRNNRYELCSSWVTPSEGEGLHPLASQAFMNYRRHLCHGTVAIRDIYAIVARHLPPDDPTYLKSMSAAEIEEIAACDTNWGPRPKQFDCMSLEEALRSTRAVKGHDCMTPDRNSGMQAPEVAM